MHRLPREVAADRRQMAVESEENMADLTSLGVKFGYGTGDTMPSAFTQIPRCKKIGGINLSNEKIDTSTLEDLLSQYAKGRQDTGGDWEVTFHSGALTALKTMMTSATSATNGTLWFEVWIPDLEDGFFVKAQPGSKIPLPDIGDNSVLEFPITLTIVEYVGLETAIEPA